MEWILVSLASALAGFVDAIVGGGGLILVPAMFAAFPTTTPATLFGTNKLASVVGTASAALQYSRRVVIPWQIAAPAAVAAAIGSWFGARAVVVTERHAPEATGALAKAASGALDRVPLCRVTNLARCLDDLAALGYWRIGMDAGAEKTLAAVAADLDKAVLVLGAEGEGLRRLTAERCDFLARLPIAVEAASLNVSNAAAVALYELARA